MNNPFRPLADELRRIAAAGFEYVDLTLEPPGAWPVAPDEARALVEEAGLGVVGHTAWYLPVASPFPALRAAARGAFVEAVDVFAAIGATHVTLHPDPVTRSYPRDEAVAGTSRPSASSPARRRSAGSRSWSRTWAAPSERAPSWRRSSTPTPPSASTSTSATPTSPPTP